MTQSIEGAVQRRPTASTVAGGLCTSASSVFVALAAVSTGTVAFFRFILAVPLLLPLAFAESREGALRATVSPKALAAGALLAGDALLWNQAITESGAGIATVIVNAQVVIVPALGWLTLGERPTALFAATVPAMVAGVALAGGLAGGATGADPTQGALLACGAAMCYALFLFFLRQAGESGSAFATVLGLTVAGALVSAVVAPFWHGLDLTPSVASLGWIVGVALSSQVVAYVLIGPALPRLSPSAGAAVLLIQPVGSVALGAAALGERPSVLQFVGCVLVLCAVYAATLADSRKGRSNADDRGQADGMPEILTPDLRIAYEASGPTDGRPLVAVHGWPDDPSCWDAVLPALHDAGYRVLRPYLRGFGPTRFRSERKPRSGQIGALGRDLADFLDAHDLSEVLLVGHDWGARAGYVVGALFPERVERLVAISAGHVTNRPDASLSWPLARAYWYEWLVATERGRRMIAADRRGFCRYLWETWSPSWSVDDAEFDRAAEAWDNDDWAEISTHAYLHRWGEADGDRAYEEIEGALLAPAPVRVATMVIHGAEDADNLPETTEGKQDLFLAGYERVVLKDVGHFPPREAPDAVADLVVDFARADRAGALA